MVLLKISGGAQLDPVLARRLQKMQPLPSGSPRGG